MTSTDTDKRGYIAGLRALADLLEQHDELPLPYNVTALWIQTARSEEDQRQAARTFARVIPGNVRKSVRDTFFDLDAEIGPINVSMILGRDSICRRVVTDVREVTEEVPDPDALATVPTVTVTKTVEDVEWVCEPILAAEREQVTA